MNNRIFLAVVVLALAVASPAAPPPSRPAGGAPAGREVWAVQLDTAYHGIMDVQLLREGDRVSAGFAFGTVQNAPVMLDTSRLAVAGDRLRGPVTLAPAPVVYTAATKPPEEKPAPQEEVVLDLRQENGRITGTVSSEQPVRYGVVDYHGLGGKPNSLPVRGRTQPNAPADDARVELIPLGVGSPGRNILSAHGRGLLLAVQLRGGKVAESLGWAVEVPQAEPPLAEPVRRGVQLVAGNRLSGEIPLRYTPPDPKEPQVDGTLTLDGVVIGDHAAGLARWDSGGKVVETSFRARVSRAATAVPLDVSKRTWEPQGEPLAADPALADRARAEALVPLRPGEPGGRPFYNTRLIHRAGREGSIPAIYAPSFEFAEVPGAATYRIDLKGVENAGTRGTFSCELAKPWMPLTALWKDLPVGQYQVTATAVDAAGKEVGKAAIPEARYDYVGGSPLDYDHWKIRQGNVAKDGFRFGRVETFRITRRPSFEGPYYRHNRGAIESALASARCQAHAFGLARYRGLYGWGGFTGGDGGDNTSIAVMARAFSQVARWSPDEAERREALALGERAAWNMFQAHRGKRPTVYKGNVANLLWVGDAYLDLHAAGRSPLLREAALDLAAALAKEQEPDGGWTDLESGWSGGVFGPSEFRTNGGEAMLVFFGRVRGELGVKDYIEVENRAHEWVKQYCLPAMMWQNTGYHSGEMVPLQDPTAPHALAFGQWMLDYAPKEQRELALVAEIARWCEERHVDWSRTPDGREPLLNKPSLWGWTRASGTPVQIAGRLAYICARLGQETKDQLWTAKAQALIQTLMAAQDPVSGGYPNHFHRTTEEVWGNLFDAVEAGDRVAAAEAVIAGKPERPAAP